MCVRDLRTQACSSLARTVEPLPIDRAVADAWAVLRVHLRDAGRSMKLNDSWIAATAISRNIPVVSQDRDFINIPGLLTVLV